MILFSLFSKQFSGRKLTWLHHLSNGDVKLGYTSKTYIINMTTTQVPFLFYRSYKDRLTRFFTAIKLDEWLII
jgi:cullin 2